MAERRRDLEERWREQAACAPYDTAVFFPTDRAGGLYPSRVTATAARLCDRCPVFDDCLDYALRHQVEGTWAGTTTAGRRRLRRELGIKAVAVTLPSFEPEPSDAPEEQSA